MQMKIGDHITIHTILVCKICNGTGRAPDNGDFYRCDCGDKPEVVNSVEKFKVIYFGELKPTGLIAALLEKM